MGSYNYICRTVYILWSKYSYLLVFGILSLLERLFFAILETMAGIGQISSTLDGSLGWLLSVDSILINEVTYLQGLLITWYISLSNLVLVFCWFINDRDLTRSCMHISTVIWLFFLRVSHVHVHYDLQSEVTKLPCASTSLFREWSMTNAWSPIRSDKILSW